MSRSLLATLCLVLSLSCSGQGVFGALFGGPANNQHGIEQTYRRVKGEKLGGYLATKFAGKKVLVLLPPEMPMMAHEKVAELPYEAVLKGLLRGMADKLTIVGKIEPKMPADLKAKLKSALGANGEDLAMMPEGQMWFDVPALDRELTPYKGKYDLLICLTSLPGVNMMMPMASRKRPVPLSKLSIMSDKGVQLVLLEGGVNKFGRAIQSKKVVAAVTYKMNIPEAAYTKMPPEDLDAAFDMRFVLITPENLQKCAAYFSH